MTANYDALPKWHEINTNQVLINESGEKLLKVSDVNSRIVCVPHYYINGVPGATENCYMRESVYSRLLAALELLPEGYGFKVFDAWRPFEVQKFLFEKHVAKIQISENISLKEAEEKAKRFVSYPSLDESKPFVHSTGGAIDLTIIDVNDCELDMGTSFDDFSPLAFTDYYEASLNDEIKNNRRLLYHVMTQAGFSNYPSEWWHYDYGDSFWASENNAECAFFGGVFKL